MRKIQLASPIIGRQERKVVMRVLKSGNLAQGPEVKAFENEFSNLVGNRECVAVNSGTSALHVALLSMGIGQGDEVLVPSFTFAATANAVSLTGAKPVFVDIDPLTYNMDPRALNQAITPKTRAIQVVHLYGLPANMPEIVQIAKQKSLLVIEDAAQAHGARIKDQSVGTFGDVAAFSFYPTKNMTTGEGGMVVFKDGDAARTARLLRNQGMEVRYHNEIIGLNLRMTDIHAAIGRQQLKFLKQWNEKRRDNANHISEKINRNLAPFVPEDFYHVYHQFTIRLSNKRDEFSRELTSNGISNGVYYPKAVHNLPSFQVNIHLPHTELATQQVLSIPVHPKLTKFDLKKITKTFNTIYKNLYG